jgi:hypothetical protein
MTALTRPSLTSARAAGPVTYIRYVVQEISNQVMPVPVGAGVWKIKQAKQIRRILEKQGRECFLAPIQVKA